MFGSARSGASPLGRTATSAGLAKAHSDRILREATQGDLALINGADSEETEANDRRQILGFLQLDLQPIRDIDKCSDIGRQRKIDRGCPWRIHHRCP